MFWANHFLGLEAGVAVGLALILGLWMYLCQGAELVTAFLQGQRVVLYRSIASIAGTLFGFSLTAMSIVLGLYSHDRLVLLRQSQHASKLWQTFLQSIKFLGLLTLMALLCLLGDRDAHPQVWLVVPFVALVGLSIARLYRVIWSVQKIVGILTQNAQPKARENA